MVNKFLGYGLLAGGILISGLSYESIRKLFGIPLPTALDNYLLLIGIVLLLAGAFLSFRKSGNKAGEEVPIYEGEGKSRKIVGYRRMK